MGAGPWVPGSPRAAPFWALKFPNPLGTVSRRVARSSAAAVAFFATALARLALFLLLRSRARNRRSNPTERTSRAFGRIGFQSHPFEAAMKNERRSFLRTIPIAFAVAAATQSPDLLAQAKPGGAGPKLDESDPQAKALGYVHDASK